MDNIITTTGLRKRFPAKGGAVEAVRGVSIDVAQGEIFGFLGPNGAGKTTTVRMLTTLLPIDAGTATVAGFDVARQPKQVRARIGYVSQLGGADELATGRENLLLQGRLYGASQAQAAHRADALAGLLDPGGFAGRRASTYSGGQQRRLGIVHEPAVLCTLSRPGLGSGLTSKRGAAMGRKRPARGDQNRYSPSSERMRCSRIGLTCADAAFFRSGPQVKRGVATLSGGGDTISGIHTGRARWRRPLRHGAVS